MHGDEPGDDLILSFFRLTEHGSKEGKRWEYLHVARTSITPSEMMPMEKYGCEGETGAIYTTDTRRRRYFLHSAHSVALLFHVHNGEGVFAQRILFGHKSSYAQL